MPRRYPIATRSLRLLAATGLALAALAPGAHTALADTSATSGSMTLTISPSADTVTDGSVVTVAGTGYDVGKGIYVAVCVDTGPGQTPTPCLGGVDMSGSAGGSAWISSNPPPYGEGLALPFNPDGSFTINLTLAATDPINGVDCRVLSCALLTRADHTRTSDRTLDVRIPLTFVEAGAAVPMVSSSTPPAPAPEVVDAPSAPATSAPTTESSAATSTSSTSMDASRTPVIATAAAAGSTTATTAAATPSTDSSTTTSTSESATAGTVELAADSSDGSSSSSWLWWVLGAAVVGVIAAAGIWRHRNRTAV